MSREPRQDKREKEGRKERIPFNRNRYKLNFEKFKEKVKDPKTGKMKDKYYYYIHQDTPGNLEAAVDAGYKFVTDDSMKSQGEGADNERDMTTARVRKVVGYGVDNKPIMGYLMQLPWEDRKADIKEAEMNRQKIEQRIKSGANPTGQMETDGRYIPEGSGISITHGRGRVQQDE